jgi:hypothetical protein
MAGNFRVLLHRNSESLHLRLEGDFDGSSAHQLLQMLGENGHGVGKIFIHTNGLKEVHPFGAGVFQKNLNGLKAMKHDLIFTGEKGPEIAPHGHRLMA